MVYELELEHLLAGFAAHSADEGELVTVTVSDFVTDDHGAIFYKYLEEIEVLCLKPFIEAGNLVSTIDHFLILIDRDKRVKVYVNELTLAIGMMTKKKVNVGDLIAKADIAGITDLNFQNIAIPKNSAFIFYFSVGWRRGLFFDHRPLTEEIDVSSLRRKLATFFESLLFAEIYSLNTNHWENLYSLGWFPFISLIADPAFEGVLTRISEGKSVDNAEKEILEKFTSEKLETLLEHFRKRDFLVPHLPFIELGIERYLAGDYISSINNIWLRIEGVLRFAFSTKGKLTNQKDLIDNMLDAVSSKFISPTLFFPEQFRDYLLRYYFKNFDIDKDKLEVSRQSISHGVSNIKSYDKKRALIGILIIDQLSYYLNLKKTEKLDISADDSTEST